MRFLHAADLHGGVTRYGVETPTGNSRIEDFGRNLEVLAGYAQDYKPDAVLFAGDTFDRRSQTPAELRVLASGLTQLLKVAPVQIIPGNHDGMATIGDPTTHALAWLNRLPITGLTVHVAPTTQIAWGKSGPYGLVALPYPHRRAFDEVLSHLPPDERVVEIGRRVEGAIEARLAELVDLAEPDMPLIFLGHLSVVGARLGAEAAMRISWDVTVSGHVFNGFDYAALGHIHRAQRVGPKAWYAGSAQYTDFTEADQAKTVLLVEAVRGKEPIVTSLSAGARPMVVLDMAEQEDGHWTSESSGQLEGAIVKVRLIPRESVPPARIASLTKMVREAGASFIKVEVVMPPQPERAATATLDADLDPVEALSRWLEAAGQPQEPALSAGRDLIAQVAG